VRGVSVKSELTHPDLHVQYYQVGRTERTIHRITGVGPQGSLGIFNDDVGTLRTALLERMYFCKVGGEFLPAPPVHPTALACLSDFADKIVEHCRGTTLLTTDEVVETYKGRKRTIYERANESLRIGGVKRKHATSMSFVKVEKGNTSKAPRCIQPRKPEYNLSLGKYIKPLEHRIYRAIKKIYRDGPTVMKGYTVKEVATIIQGKWNSFHDPVAIGLDATKFDMHVHATMLGWEHSIYQRIFQHCPELRKLLSWQMYNRGKGYCYDGKLRYKVKGKRFSGDMNTALGNCLIMCALIYAYAKSKGIPVKLVNNGDDCVVFMERIHEVNFGAGLSQWFLTRGFRMTVEAPVYDLARIEFCQMRPIRTKTGITMVRNIKTALEKDTMTTINVTSQIALQKWMHAVGECGLALCSGVPILQAFYQFYMRHGVASNMAEDPTFCTGMRMMRGDLVSKASEVTAESRLDVYVAWGITPDEQVALEKQFDAAVMDYSPRDTCYTPPSFDGISLSW